MHKASTKALLALLAGIIFLIGIAGFVYYYLPLDLGSFSYYRERITYAMHPSARQAYAYGLEHFDSAKPRSHNIDRAEYFFREALKQDENYGYSHHQLARIAFLRGDFPGARQEIDKEIALHGDTNPSAFYVRGLIQGYQGAYSGAEKDFARFIGLSPEGWAGYNDYAWVTMKQGKYQLAIDALQQGLKKHPGNPWLLNSFAIALYEAHLHSLAAPVASSAKAAVMKLTPEEWAAANPGNDPRIAGQGLETFRSATIENLEKIINSK